MPMLRTERKISVQDIRRSQINDPLKWYIFRTDFHSSHSLPILTDLSFIVNPQTWRYYIFKVREFSLPRRFLIKEEEKFKSSDIS